MDVNQINEIALSLVREYLSAKRLTNVLKCLDEEQPRGASSISKRSLLIQSLHIEKLVKKNQEQNLPLHSILEIVIKETMDKNAKTDSSGSIFNEIGVDNTLKEPVRDEPYPGLIKLKKNKVQFDKDVVDGLLHKKMNNVRISTNTPVVTEQLVQPKSSVKSPVKIQLGNVGYDQEQLNIPGSSGSGRNSARCGDLTLDDVEDSEIDASLTFRSKQSLSSTSENKEQVWGIPISRTLAKELKILIFGSPTANFNEEWKKQNLNFSANSELRYGLVQKKGGPCGVLACLQSYIILELLYPKTGKPIGLTPNNDQQDAILKKAIQRILWKIGGFKEATVAVFTSRYALFNPSDKDPESLTLYNCSTLESLDNCLSKHLYLFKHENDGGCISLLCSALLTRGIQNIRSDMDEYNGNVMGAHGYCSQEIVNLFLTGYAKSNVFDGVIELDSGGTEASYLHGISTQSEIGFLSLFEHYDSCQVGLNMKNPVYPIWVICSESHFTVLFSTSRVLTELAGSELKHFQLIYYDTFGNQDSEIQLLVEIRKDVVKEEDDELVPPLEHCIRTKWPEAIIEWRGSEPLL